MEEFKNGKDLHELLLLYDNLALEVEENGEVNKELAVRLYNVYDAMSDILRDNLDELKEELFDNPTLMKDFSLGALQTIYDESNSEKQKWMMDNLHYWSRDK